MDSAERLLDIATTVSSLADDKISRIHGITRRSRMLALNAAIEAHRFGSVGKGFAVVADEVKSISSEISELATSLQGELRGQLETMTSCAGDLNSEVDSLRGERMIDLAFNAIELVDRNLYERSCDVRWWATDSAVVEAVAAGADDVARRHASQRLGVILDSYTVYLDLWIADANGKVIATGRPGRFSRAIGTNVANESWFRDAMATRDGNSFAVADVSRVPALDNAVSATYATAIREGGDVNGKAIGVLGIFFDWETQARGIVQGVRLSPIERTRTRCLLLDSRHRVIASSDGGLELGQAYPLKTNGKENGYLHDGRLTVGFARTPGYETYKGLGWFGVIEQRN